ncbi:MAG TPA: GTPase [Thermoplasmata archaeon]|nr:GTPase [Thermoplasmata archaeon]
MTPRRIVILGAAGRDFHTFNMLYRGRFDAHVVAFTAAQIPRIAGRRYPPTLAGPGYPDGIPIVPESELPDLIRRESVDTAVLAYSDLAHVDVMHKASIALAAGASFLLPGPEATMLTASRPVISVCAVRTGAGKSPLTRYVGSHLRRRGWRAAIVRHPMPYGDLAAQAVQRFATLEDLDRADCTIEEREEYEPHIREGAVVFAGVDYAAILKAAEAESDILVWDGGNNDLPFFRPDLHIVVADPFRAGHELAFHPGETNFRRADVIVVSKANTATPESIRRIEDDAARMNPRAERVRGGLRMACPDADRLRGHRVLVVEDGPTVTHGGLSTGAGTLVARAHGGIIVDPRPYAVGSIREVFESYPHLVGILPSMGYGPEQVHDLEETIRATPADFVVDGSPVDLRRLLRVRQPVLNVRYDYEDIDLRIAQLIDRFLAAHPVRPATAAGPEAGIGPAPAEALKVPG